MAAKSKLSRTGTMKATAKAAVSYLYSKGPRSYQFKGATVDDLHSMGVEVPDTSAGAGAKAGSSKGKKAAGKPAMKRDSTMAKTVAEAKQLLGSKVTFDEGKKTRSARKATPAKKASPAKKPALKRAGTMQNTAKEGKNFLKRTKGRKGKGKK